MQFLSTRAVIVNGRDTCSEPPYNNLKRTKRDIEGEKRKKEKRERKATRKGLFLLQTRGKPLPVLSDEPSKLAVKFRFGGRKRIIRFVSGTIRDDAGRQHPKAPNKVPKVHLRRKYNAVQSGKTLRFSFSKLREWLLVCFVGRVSETGVSVQIAKRQICIASRRQRHQSIG